MIPQSYGCWDIKSYFSEPIKKRNIRKEFKSNLIIPWIILLRRILNCFDSAGRMVDFEKLGRYSCKMSGRKKKIDVWNTPWRWTNRNWGVDRLTWPRMWQKYRLIFVFDRIDRNLVLIRLSKTLLARFSIFINIHSTCSVFILH